MLGCCLDVTITISTNEHYEVIKSCTDPLGTSLYNFYGATMTIKGSLLTRVPIVSDLRSKIFVGPFFAKIIDVWGLNPDFEIPYPEMLPK